MGSWREAGAVEGGGGRWEGGGGQMVAEGRGGYAGGPTQCGLRCGAWCWRIRTGSASAAPFEACAYGCGDTDPKKRNNSGETKTVPKSGALPTPTGLRVVAARRRAHHTQIKFWTACSANRDVWACPP